MTQGHEDGRLEELEDDILKLYCKISCNSYGNFQSKDFVLEELTRIIKGNPQYQLNDEEKNRFFEIRQKKGRREYNAD